MQSTIQQAQPLTDIVEQYTIEILQAQRRALQIVLEVIDTPLPLPSLPAAPIPQSDSPSSTPPSAPSAPSAPSPATTTTHLRAITQHLNMRLRGALHILKMRPPKDRPVSPPSPVQAGEGAPRSSEGVPSSSNGEAANSLLAAAGAAASGLDERIDSPRDSSLATHTSSPPTPPPYLTPDEELLLAQAQKGGKRFTPMQIRHILYAWQKYADATGTKSPYDVPREAFMRHFRSRPKGDD